MGFLVPRSKLTEYLLNPRHPEGGSKARFFLSRGFSVDAPEVLELALLAHAQAAQEVQRRPGLYGDGEVLILEGPFGLPHGSSSPAKRLVSWGGRGYLSLGDRLPVEGEMIREHDLVVLKHDHREVGLEAGDVGAVVLVYPKGGYMVEFVDHEGNTVALLDLKEDEVLPLRGPALLRAKVLG